MKQHKVNESITIYDEQVDGSTYLKDLPNNTIEKLVTWKHGEELLYKTPLIKLESIITTSGVNLYTTGFSEQAQKKLFKKPYIKIN